MFIKFMKWMCYSMKWITSTENNCWRSYDKISDSAGSTIEKKKKLQSVDGFGGCFNELGMIALNKLNEKNRREVFDELFCEDKCNFNYNRMSVGANDFSEIWYSYNETDGDFDMKNFSIERDHKYVIPYIREAQKRVASMTLFASPWSPPTWLKFPKANNYGTLVWEEKYLKAYAKYIRLFIEAYKKEGIKINQFHIQNEPCSSQKFPSCIWTGEEFKDFIENYLSYEFDNNNIDTEIWLGTINGPETDNRMLYTRYNNYANIVLDSSRCREYVKGVSYQWAGKFAVEQTHDAFPDLKLIQSESECGDGNNTWQFAMYIFEMIKHYFRNGVRAYIYWNMVLEENAESTWGWKQNSLISVSDGKVKFNPEFYVMKHFSHFVKPNAHVIEVKGMWSPNVLAFENPDNSKAAVIMNPFDVEKTVTIENTNYILPAKSFNTILL